MTSQDAQRAVLVERLTVLARRHEALERHLRQEDGRLEADFSDRVAFTEMDEVLERLDDASLVEIRAVRNALKRLDAGTYGTCIGCGDTIADGRLHAVPATPFCTTCASARDA